MRIQFWHVIILLLVVLLLFGSSRLPELARSVGKSMKIFKSEVRELREDTGAPPTPPPPTPGGAAPRDGASGTDPAVRPTPGPPAGGPPADDTRSRER
jgi:sec-independent protein translocase protein TatA